MTTGFFHGNWVHLILAGGFDGDSKAEVAIASPRKMKLSRPALLEGMV
jgi:hypothetical protein